MEKRFDNTKPLFREVTFARESVDPESRTVDLAFSSEAQYERWFGIEILDHGTKSIRLGRLTDAAPLLLNHDMDRQIGVVESVEIGSDRVGRAKVRFGKSALADEIFNDVKDGIRQKVSVGYMVHKMILDGKDGDVEKYRVTDWEPFEVSIVSVPADASVGVGRSVETPAQEPEPEPEKQPEQIDNQKPIEESNMTDKATVDTTEIEKDVRQKELARITELEKIGQAFATYNGPELARQFIAEGKDPSELNAAILARVGKQKPMPSAELGLSEKEIKAYSFLRLMNALSDPGNKAARDAAGYEFELSDAARAKLGKETRGAATVPFDVLAHSAKRDLTAGVAADGGNSVATDLLAGSFIDLLRNKLAIQQVGATMMTGLVGNVAIPRQSGAATAFWVAENAASTESQQTMAQVTLSPKTVGAFTDYSRRLFLQSSLDVEAFVRNDLAQVLALAIDVAAINGSGASNQPRGILQTGGIGSVALGTNGTDVTWASIVALESAVANANADVGNMAYLTNARQRGKMKSISKVSGQNGFIWDNGDTPVNGYRCGISNQVPFNLVKGSSGAVCSAILFGNFADLMIGMWGGLDILVDPYTGSNAGTVRITAFQDVDIALRNIVSFAAIVDAL